MRGICRLCNRKITEHRSSHLRNKHGVDTYHGAVAEYFLTPEELGISREEFERMPENAEIKR